MTSNELRTKYLEFFRKRGHAVIPSASLVPENDPSVLFNTAGMQPLVPYLLGEKHPAGTRLVDVQKCVRTGDIEDIGDNRHLTFFEMLGNWSLGDYFKKESIAWSMEFLTSKEEGLGLDPKRLYVTVFKGLPAQAGEAGIPRDDDAIKYWKEQFEKLGMKAEVAGEDEMVKGDVRIIPLGVNDNFWIAGTTGPCGGDTEIFYDTKPEAGKLEGKFGDLVDSFRIIEIWNNVFMEFNKTPEGKYEKLAKQNVDTGMGLERTLAVLGGKSTVYDTDLFEPILKKIDELSTKKDGDKARKIVADHVRTSTFMIGDGVEPSNSDRGYILRRLIRRAVRYTDALGISKGGLAEIAKVVVEKYNDVYSNLEKRKFAIEDEINREEEKFRKTLVQGMKEFEKVAASEKSISGSEAFDLYQSYGFPFEMTAELAKERGLKVDKAGFEEEFRKHQDLSRVGADKKFKGGLAGTGEMETKYHTATHLLNAALRRVLGEHVYQKGSNITAERLRFDFAHPTKMTDEEKMKVEDLVNEKIAERLPVVCEEIPKEEAKNRGAIGVFDDKYGDIVKVYKIGGPAVFSMELCGGPHVENTGELGHFKIVKEEAVSQGVRRIKAVLE